MNELIHVKLQQVYVYVNEHAYEHLSLRLRKRRVHVNLSSQIAMRFFKTKGAARYRVMEFLPVYGTTWPGLQVV
jgi:hypothetical protein